MKRSSLTAMALIAAALSGTAALAAEPARLVVAAGETGVVVSADDAAARGAGATSRADVLAALRDAQRSGAVVGAGEIGVVANPTASTSPASTKTREQVRAEFREALRTGDVTASGEFGRKVNELSPQRFGRHG